MRTPGYVYGVNGTIERVCGRHGDPAFLAFGLSAPTLQLYHVRFQQKDVWPEQAESEDFVEVELYEHWLEAVPNPTESSNAPLYPEQSLFDHTGSKDDCVHVHYDHSHQHHDDDHHHHDDDHVHEARPTVKVRALDCEGPPRPGQELFAALKRIVIDKRKVLLAADLTGMCQRLDTAGGNLDGANLVVRAWQDAGF